MYGFVKFYDCIEQLKKEKFILCMSNKHILIKRPIKNVLVLSPKNHFLDGSFNISPCGSLYSSDKILKIYAPKGTKINKLMENKNIMTISEFNQIRCDITSCVVYPGLYWDD